MIPVRFVIFQENGYWVAQCLEYDVGAQAGSLQQIQLRVSAVLQCELEESLGRYRTPFGGLDRAPREYSAIWTKRSASYTSLLAIGMPRIRFEVALCGYSQRAENPDKRSSLAEYCVWATSAGCSVRSSLLVGQTGYVERVVKMNASGASRALEVGVLDGDILAPTTLARLDRRLGLKRLFRHLAQRGARSSGT